MNYHLNFRLEEEEKLLNAESYYKKALSLDETFQEAEEALTKLRKHMQVILYFLFIWCSQWQKMNIESHIKSFEQGGVKLMVCLILCFPTPQ